MVVEGDQNDELISKIKPQLVSMRRYSSAYSKHLISSMQSKFLRIPTVLIMNLVERLLEKGTPGKPEGKSAVVHSEEA